MTQLPENREVADQARLRTLGDRAFYEAMRVSAYARQFHAQRRRAPFTAAITALPQSMAAPSQRGRSNFTRGGGLFQCAGPSPTISSARRGGGPEQNADRSADAPQRTSDRVGVRKAWLKLGVGAPVSALGAVWAFRVIAADVVLDRIEDEVKSAGAESHGGHLWGSPRGRSLRQAARVTTIGRTRGADTGEGNGRAASLKGDAPTVGRCAPTPAGRGQTRGLVTDTGRSFEGRWRSSSSSAALEPQLPDSVKGALCAAQEAPGH